MCGCDFASVSQPRTYILVGYLMVHSPSAREREREREETHSGEKEEGDFFFGSQFTSLFSCADKARERRIFHFPFRILRISPISLSLLLLASQQRRNAYLNRFWFSVILPDMFSWLRLICVHSLKL